MNNDETTQPKFRIHGVKRKRLVSEDAYKRQLKHARERKAKEKEETGPPEHAFKLISVAAPGTFEACAEYVQTLNNVRWRGSEWIRTPTPYLGREHIDVAKLGADWFVAFVAYLKHRQQQGYESEKQVRMSLHVFADYVLLYLPWWLELNPKSEVRFPSSPKQFLRFLFVSRTTIEDEGSPGAAVRSLPPTFLDYLPMRRGTVDGRNRVVAQIEKFFDYVITAFEDNEDIAGRGMINPIRRFFDLSKSSRRTKSNKVPFPAEVYPHLVHYAQGLEAFGEYLQMLVYERDIFADMRWGEPQGYDTARYGYMPFVIFRGNVHPIRWVPPIYNVERRTIHLNPAPDAGIFVSGHRINKGPNGSVSIRVPHLSLLRLLMGLIETGLRGQGMQWLDRDTWDTLNHRKVPLQELYTNRPSVAFTRLLVNTDKSKDEPWSCLIPWRLRRSLLAEQAFQKSINEPGIDSTVPYERREVSRFDPVVPMFRSYDGLAPYNDSSYAARWLTLLGAFQEYYANREAWSATRKGVSGNNESLQFVIVRPATIGDQETPKVSRGKKNGGPYCPLTYTAVSTPHACRTTYATLRDGDLEVSEIAQQIGHSSEITTTYYQLPSEARVVEKLEKLDASLMGYDVHGSSNAHVHPEAAGSTVRAAFDKDRQEALNSHGFINGISFWSTEDLAEGDENALELLRMSPASVIKWHPTHVCPVGNQCPSDIIPRIGGPLRCGLCPLAAKCVDHLPGIAAKKNELTERIRTAAARIRKIEERSDASDLADALHREMQLDTKELMGWELSEEILRDKAGSMKVSSGDLYHVDEPELVRRQLQFVTRNRTESEFFLQRVSEANAYPSMESPEVRARAARYIRRLLANAGKFEEAATLELPAFQEIEVFASLLKPMMEGMGLSLEDVAKAVDGDVVVRLSGSTPLLIGDGGGNGGS